MEMDIEDFGQAVERIRNGRPLEAEPYYTADTSLSDEVAIWLFKETIIPVITRDGSKWFKGVKVSEVSGRVL